MDEVAGEGRPPAEVDGALVVDSRALGGGVFLGALGLVRLLAFGVGLTNARLS